MNTIIEAAHFHKHPDGTYSPCDCKMPSTLTELRLRAEQSERMHFAAEIEVDALDQRVRIIKTALRNAFVIIEALNISVERELAPEIKKAIAESSKEIRKALEGSNGTR